MESNALGFIRQRLASRPRLRLTFVTLLATLAVACKGNVKAEGKTQEKSVRVQAVGRDDIEEVLSYPADLKPWVEVRVYSRLPDRILAFPWKNGDEIKRGNRLAVVRAGGVSEGMDQVGAQIDALDAQIETQQHELTRMKTLRDSGAIADAEYERLETALRANQAQRRALIAGRGQLAATASDGTIVAPISGTVADKMLQVGDMAQPGVPLCRIIAVDQLKLELRLVESDVPKVRTGLEVQLKLDAYPARQFRGVVTTVLPYLDQQTRTNTVEVTLDNPKDAKTGERALKPGMFGRAELVVARRNAALVAPEPALLLDTRILEQQKPGEVLRKAFVVDEQRIARQRMVKLGARKGSSLEVLEGLAEKEQLVVLGQHGLKDGQKVQLVESGKP
ncbi:MAG TPA: efflux RND transporter periplasmic adaptor subunit [Polyangiaceae bacterium]|nr:efflux RND transporter periplasmic adaptor subunit [Polyangiaceae bacterium]